jgi:hypothetical protein
MVLSLVVNAQWKGAQTAGTWSRVGRCINQSLLLQTPSKIVNSVVASKRAEQDASPTRSSLLVCRAAHHTARRRRDRGVTGTRRLMGPSRTTFLEIELQPPDRHCHGNRADDSERRRTRLAVMQPPPDYRHRVPAKIILAAAAAFGGLPPGFGYPEFCSDYRLFSQHIEKAPSRPPFRPRRYTWRLPCKRVRSGDQSGSGGSDATFSGPLRRPRDYRLGRK